MATTAGSTIGRRPTERPPEPPPVRLERAPYVNVENLRRVEFDIERDRPATLVVVPVSPQDEPQVLAVQPEEYEGVANALVVIRCRLAAAS